MAVSRVKGGNGGLVSVVIARTNSFLECLVNITSCYICGFVTRMSIILQHVSENKLEAEAVQKRKQEEQNGDPAQAFLRQQ